jgi:hypothetical protein
MGEVLFVAAILLLLIGAMGFYFYSRIIYTEKKLNLLETILLDIKMMMDMEEAPHPIPPPKENIILSEPEQINQNDAEELKGDATGYYTSVINSIANDVSGAVPVPSDNIDVNSVHQQASAVEYELLNRDELVELAEKRSLRVTKRMNRQALVTLLRESDKNSSSMTEQVTDGPLSGAGAPIDGSEDIPSETI